jgi:hypothetical protein
MLLAHTSNVSEIGGNGSGHCKGRKRTSERTISIGKIPLCWTACNHFEAEQRQHKVPCVDRVGSVTLVPTEKIQTKNAEYRESRVRGRGTGGRGNLIQYTEAKGA